MIRVQRKHPRASLPVVITVLGCGTSTGVPLIQCKCRVCKSTNPKNHRLRSSIWVQAGHGGQKSLVIDTSTDFRQQALREGIGRVDAVLYTHPHADHVNGIDELRSFNFLQKGPIPVYGNAWSQQELTQRFQYAFLKKFRPGIPQLVFHRIPKSIRRFKVQGIEIQPISVKHGTHDVLAYRLGTFAYLTDCSYIPEKSLERLKGLEVLILDCVRMSTHPTHLNLSQAFDVIQKVKPRMTFLTHMGHDFDYQQLSKRLPKQVALAFDGLKIRLNAQGQFAYKKTK